MWSSVGTHYRRTGPPSIKATIRNAHACNMQAHSLALCTQHNTAVLWCKQGARHKKPVVDGREAAHTPSGTRKSKSNSPLDLMTNCSSDAAEEEDDILRAAAELPAPPLAAAGLAAAAGALLAGGLEKVVFQLSLIADASDFVSWLAPSALRTLFTLIWGVTCCVIWARRARKAFGGTAVCVSCNRLIRQ